MKTFLAIAMTTVLGTTALAAGADQFEIRYNCEPVTLLPDTGMNLKLMEGGIAGMTMIQITRTLLSHQRVDNYAVRQLPMDPRMAGSPRVFQGKGITFSINMTTTPMEDGKRLAELTTQDNGTEMLKCEVLN